MSLNQVTKTENDAKSHGTTNLAVLDLFFKTVRNLNEKEFQKLLDAAYKEDPLDVLKIIFHLRDCRGGKGERKLFIMAVQWMIQRNYSHHFIKNMDFVVECGRYDDLLHFVHVTQNGLGKKIANVFAQTLKKDVASMLEGKPISLCAKWAPTEKGKHDKAVKLICAELKCNKATYRRKYCSPLRGYLHVLERYMSSKNWKKIDYSKVPSQAMKKLKKAFERNDPDRFQEYILKLKKGEAKVNSSVVEPHEMVMQYISKGGKMTKRESDPITEAQWKGIIDRVKTLGTMKNCCVLSDVSGSMTGDMSIIVSIALGIMISSVQEGPFKNKVMTFETNPKWFTMPEGNLLQKVKALKDAPWGGTTDFQAAIKKVVKMARKEQCPIPEKLFVISDMQFNAADSSFMTNLESLKAEFMKENVKIPQIIFWNVRANTQSFPAQADSTGVALVSGFSPSILKSLMTGKVITPWSTLRKTLDDKRYQCVKLDNGNDMEDEDRMDIFGE